MTEEEKEIMRQIANNIESKSMGYHNFDSTMNYDSALDMDGQSVLDMDYGSRYMNHKQIEPRGQSTYELTIFYTDNFGSGTPVNITLFQPYFNTGTFVGDDLVFTNVAGETATIQGDTEIYRAIHNRSETQPFRVSFARMDVVAAAQFAQRWSFSMRGVFGGEKRNNLTPRTFLTPEQFQLLRVDIPTNWNVNGERGISFDVNATEVIANGGIRMTLFVDKIMDPMRKMQGKDEIVNLDDPRGLMAPGPAKSLQQQIVSLQQNELLQAKLKRLSR